MGTNYYAHEPQCASACAHCDQDIEWHIGKSLVMFEAHENSPWGPIESWADWKRVLTENSLPIVDEYGQRHDLADFIERVEATGKEARRRQYQWIVDHGYPLDDDYLDADGFSFTRGEFS